jgi:hypothetical protein
LGAYAVRREGRSGNTRSTPLNLVMARSQRIPVCTANAIR